MTTITIPAAYLEDAHRASAIEIALDSECLRDGDPQDRSGNTQMLEREVRLHGALCAADGDVEVAAEQDCGVARSRRWWRDGDTDASPGWATTEADAFRAVAAEMLSQAERLPNDSKVRRALEVGGERLDAVAGRMDARVS